MKKYKIVSITQIYNEIEKENLHRFFKYLKPVVDQIVIYDDCSTDGSYEYAKSQTTHVLRGAKNDFTDEINHRQIMLVEALKLKPDFILSIDTDEVLTRNSESLLQDLCRRCHADNLDGFDFHEINLWRSWSWRRTDSLFDEGWFCRLWKVTPDIGFKIDKKGLHQQLVPSSVKITERQEDVGVIHYGFSTKKNLTHKYLVYRSHGQRGYVMLDRLINEDSMELEVVPESLFPTGLYSKEPKPEKIPFIDALTYANQYKEEVFRPKYSIACLIYKSVDWLEFVYQQVLKYTDMKDVEFFFVANDANEEVLNYLRNNYIPHFEFNNSEIHQKEWYINNVYRAYNYAANVAKGDFMVLINSDMCFSHGWFEALKSAYNGENLIASRLVESGKLRTGKFGIEKDFGYTIANYKEDEFLMFADSIKQSKVEDGGLFMPLFVKKDIFIKVGGYPEGNLKENADIFSKETSLPNEPQVPGDAILMRRMETQGVKHQTAMGSVVYHFQCGEKDDDKKLVSSNIKTEIAVCNDNCKGFMGERVLWSYLSDSIIGAYPVDTSIVGKVGYETRASDYIKENHPHTSIIIQNATFINRVDPSVHTVMFLQDDLRLMGRSASQQESNLKFADTLVTNSIQTSLSYPEYDFEIISVGVDEELFSPKNKNSVREKYGFGEEKIGIFVGSFSEVKGWSKIVGCIQFYKEITWILVSKYDEIYSAQNVRVFNHMGQEKLSELLNCADFFIVGSPVETQCLAAIEANLCNVPVVMPLVGIYKDFSEEERGQVGVFGDNLIEGVAKVFVRHFEPRVVIIERKLTVDASLEKWRKLMTVVSQKVRIKNTLSLSSPKTEALRINLFKVSFVVRKFLIKYILGESYWILADLTTVAGVKALLRKILAKLRLLSLIKRSLKKFY